MVAVGSLKKTWIDISEDISEEEFNNSFKDYFGENWRDILNAVDMSFEYNVYNTAYFSVGDIKPVENLNLDQLFEEKGLNRPPNVVVS